MPTLPDSFTSLILSGVVGAWVLAIIGVFALRRYYSNRLERLGEASSEEVVAELDEAYRTLPRARLRTQTEYLPFVIERIREQIDSGLEDQQVETLLARIENHRLGEQRQALFPITLGSQSSELRLRWTCDAAHRIDLNIEGHPKVIRALRDLRKQIPKATVSDEAGHA